MSKPDRQQSSPLRTVCLVFLLLWVLSPSQLHAATLNVGPDQTYLTIQAALDVAQTGDTIFVDVGTYAENVVLQNGITIEGEETARTKIVGQPGISEDTVTIMGNSTIRNMTIMNTVTGFSAISISSSVRGVSITNNLIVGSHTSNTGIQCAASSSLTITNNTIDGSTTGITCTGPTTMTFENNIVSNNTTGINFQSVTGTVNYNDVYNNGANSYTQGPNDIVGNLPADDPKFVDPTINDYHLQTGSACLNAGDPNPSFNNYQVSTSPVVHSRNDCGAYGGPNRDTTPFQPQNVVPTTPSPDTINLNWNANLAYDIANYYIYYDNQVHTITDDIPSPPYRNSLTVAATTANCPLTPSPPVCSTTLPLMFTAPSLSVSFGDSELFLTWSAPSNLVTSYNVYYKEHTASTWIQIPNIVGTSYTLTGLMDSTLYDVYVTAVVSPTFYFNVTALDDFTPPHESILLDPDAVSISINGGVASESPPSNVVSDTPEPIVPFPDLPDQGHCFIATAAYGSSWEPQVKILRIFRDEYLEPYDLGRRFIAWYYHHSPPWARYLNEHDWLKPMVRVGLIPAVGIAYFFVAATGTEKVLIFILVALCLIGGPLILDKVKRSRG